MGNIVPMSNYVMSSVMSHHVMPCHIMSCHVTSCNFMSCHVTYTAATLLVCGHATSTQCIMVGRQKLLSHCKHMSLLFVSLTKVDHGASINLYQIRNTDTLWYLLLWTSVHCITIETSFLLKRNGPNDLNKMISKVCGCKMGQGEWQVFS